jgi:hypothetical protein
VLLYIPERAYLSPVRLAEALTLTRSRLGLAFGDKDNEVPTEVPNEPDTPVSAGQTSLSFPLSSVLCCSAMAVLKPSALPGPVGMAPGRPAIDPMLSLRFRVPPLREVTMRGSIDEPKDSLRCRG